MTDQATDIKTERLDTTTYFKQENELFEGFPPREFLVYEIMDFYTERSSGVDRKTGEPWTRIQHVVELIPLNGVPSGLADTGRIYSRIPTSENPRPNSIYGIWLKFLKAALDLSEKDPVNPASLVGMKLSWGEIDKTNPVWNVMGRFKPERHIGIFKALPENWEVPADFDEQYAKAVQEAKERKASKAAGQGASPNGQSDWSGPTDVAATPLTVNLGEHEEYVINFFLEHPEKSKFISSVAGDAEFKATMQSANLYREIISGKVLNDLVAAGKLAVVDGMIAGPA